MMTKIEYRGWIIKSKIKGFRMWYVAMPKKHPYTQFVLQHSNVEYLKQMIDSQIEKARRTNDEERG